MSGPAAAATLLAVDDLVVEFGRRRGRMVHAVSGVSFSIAPGETLGLVGESGGGKSTTARAIMQLPPPTAGRVVLGGADLTALGPRALRRERHRFQMVFQDPVSSLNPRRRVRDIVAMPLVVQGGGTAREHEARVRTVLEAVGLDPDETLDRRPFQFSGGQCQRISIARALVLDPELLVCDEPVSALDVSVQAQILNLLEDLKARHHLTMLFISHDLAVVRNVCDRVAVMYLGRLCEIAPSAAIYRRPAHPYTAALLSAVPAPDPNRPPRPVAIEPGEVPSPLAPPPGCRFSTRCPRAAPVCSEQRPPMREIAAGHRVACHFPLGD